MGGTRKYYHISHVSEMFDLHPQTLRNYEREGLIRPIRSAGNTRLYDDETMERIELIVTLTRDLGVNLAGVEVILNMRSKMIMMQEEFQRILLSVAEEMGRRPRRGETYAIIPVQQTSIIPKGDD